jgi:FkbH-like protein
MTRRVKAVIWDLDGTVWDGILGEAMTPVPRPAVVALIRELDDRGVLQSIASRNSDEALDALAGFQLAEYFLHPQLGAGAKSAAVARICDLLGVATDATVFVDDEPYDRAEVKAAHPDILCLDAAEAPSLLARGDLVIDAGTRLNRRRLHLVELQRRAAEAGPETTSEQFLESLDMRLALRRALPSDLPRVHELMERTHQLTTVGDAIAADELAAACWSSDHLAIVADLTDRFGAYGTIGFALIQAGAHWTLRALMISCRVRDRGIGSAVLACAQRGAVKRGKPLRAHFLRTPRNRIMYVTLKLAGFQDCPASDPPHLEADPSLVSPLPAWLRVDDEAGLL